MGEWLTIDQVADLLECSKDTVRRRIKSGEIDAEKRIGNYGLQWMVDADKFNKVMQVVDAVPVTRSVSVAELEQAMQKAIANAVSSAVNTEIKPLQENIDLLNDKLDKQEEMLKNHYRLVDERLRSLSAVKENNETFWERYLNKFINWRDKP